MLREDVSARLDVVSLEIADIAVAAASKSAADNSNAKPYGKAWEAQLPQKNGAETAEHEHHYLVAPLTQVKDYTDDLRVPLRRDQR